MKKNSFIEGALISTIGIVLCKILGLLYVIPFRAIVGVEGSVLYGYAYTIYSVLLDYHLMVYQVLCQKQLVNIIH